MTHHEGRADLNFLQKAGLESVWIGCRIIASLPYRFRYGVLAPLIGFILGKLLHYRRKVVDANLRNSFPEKSDAERRSIRESFYRTLSEVMIDTIGMAAMSDTDCRRHVRVRDLDRLLDEIGDSDVLFATAHFGCWEYDSFWGLYTDRHYVAAVYHPLENRMMDELYLRLRKRTNTELIPMKETIRYYIKNRERPAGGRRIAIGLIADQNPPRRPNSHWFRFLNQDTIFFDGCEKMALKFRLPVYFCRQRRIRPGYYELSFVRIYDGTQSVEAHEITRRYAQLLEAEIREDPGMWLWSHRRWKHRKDEVWNP